MSKVIIETKKAPAAIGSYVQATRVGNFLFTSGQLGIDAKTGKMAEGVQEQARLALENLKAILTEAGLDFANVVKTTVFLADMADFAVVNEVYSSYFKEPYPSRSCVAVKTLPLNGLVEIEAIAISH